MATPNVVGAENPTDNKSDFSVVGPDVEKVMKQSRAGMVASRKRNGKRNGKRGDELNAVLKPSGFHLGDGDDDGGGLTAIYETSSGKRIPDSKEMVLGFYETNALKAERVPFTQEILAKCKAAMTSIATVDAALISKVELSENGKDAAEDGAATEVSVRPDSKVSILSPHELSEREKSLNKANEISECWLKIEKLMTIDAQTAWELGEQFSKLKSLGLSYREISDKVGKGKSWVESCVANYKFYVGKRIDGYNWQTHDLTRRASIAAAEKLIRVGVKKLPSLEKTMAAVLKSNARTTKGAADAIIASVKSDLSDEQMKKLKKLQPVITDDTLKLKVDVYGVEATYYGSHGFHTVSPEMFERFKADLLRIKNWFEDATDKLNHELEQRGKSKQTENQSQR